MDSGPRAAAASPPHPAPSTQLGQGSIARRIRPAMSGPQYRSAAGTPVSPCRLLGDQRWTHHISPTPASRHRVFPDSVMRRAKWLIGEIDDHRIRYVVRRGRKGRRARIIRGSRWTVRIDTTSATMHSMFMRHDAAVARGKAAMPSAAPAILATMCVPIRDTSVAPPSFPA